MLSFAKVSVAVLALASFTQAAITIATPNIKGNSTNTITWTSSDINNDPDVFSIELINPSFNSQFALANNVATTEGSITFQLPVVAPGPGYTIEFVNTGNINSVFATSASFSVQQNDASSSSASASGASSASASGASSSAVSVSRTSALTSSAATLTQTGTLASSTAPLSASSASIGSSASAASASAASAIPSATSKPSGAMGLIPSGSFAAIVAAAAALLF